MIPPPYPKEVNSNLLYLIDGKPCFKKNNCFDLAPSLWDIFVIILCAIIVLILMVFY